MNITLDIVNKKTKIPFTVRIINKGDKYGLDNCLTNEEDKPLVEFYDRRYNHTEFGQFTGGRYYASTLLGECKFNDTDIGKTGLCLDGGIPEWSIDADTCKIIVAWIKNHLR